MDNSISSNRTVHFRIWRQDSPDQPGRYEDFKVPYHRGANVISCLMEIQRNPVNTEGKKTTPVIWESSCLEEVCGSCAMNINGKVRMACSALVDQLSEPITLAPMRKFPLVRDLAVKRDRMFDALKQVRAWIEVDGTHNLGPGPRMSQEEQGERYVLSTCMTCGCCLEACPQIKLGNAFIGAAAISQALLFHEHPTGKLQDDARIAGLMGPGGIEDCGKAQNCVRVCPKHIPLTASISRANGVATKKMVKDLFTTDTKTKRKAGGPG